MSGKPQIDGCRVVALGDAWEYGQGQITWNELEARAHAAPAEAHPVANGVVQRHVVTKFSDGSTRVEEVSTAPSAPVGVVGVRHEIQNALRELDAVMTAEDNTSDAVGCAELALQRALEALAQQPAAPRNSSGHCPDSSGHSRVESILLRAGFNPDEAARIAARAVQQGGGAR